MKANDRWWLPVVAVVLLVSSAVGYVIHYMIFRDPHHIFIFTVHEIAFLPIEVLLVGIVIERILARREKNLRRQKLNMVIGTFFSELGTDLLKMLTCAVDNIDEAFPVLAVRGKWTQSDYKKAFALTRSFRFDMDLSRLDMEELKQKLVSNREMLVMLLGNPNLLEHEEFTDLLWAVFHLLDEVATRGALECASPEDLRHIGVDAHRVYLRLVREWLRYCRHLQIAYPYMFGYVIKRHPLRPQPKECHIPSDKRVAGEP